MTQTATNPLGAEVVSLDSSVLFNIPRNRDAKTGKGSTEHLGDAELLDFYFSMYALVERGLLSFPQRVRNEAKKGPYQDLARAFTAKAWLLKDANIMVPSDAHIQAVINTELAERAGWGAESEDADPHVIALGMTLTEQLGKPCAVATRDNVMIEFCEDHGIDVLGTRAFVEFVQAHF